MRPLILKLLVFSALLWQCKSAHIVDIYYTDQNNNRYTVTNKSLMYSPITAKESSSGTYSGGEAVSVKISKKDALQVATLAQLIMDVSEGTNYKREMLTSVLVIKTDSTSKQCILKRSEKRTEFEVLLRQLKEQ